LLDRNPFLWVTNRERWPTLQIWLLLLIPLAGWAWLSWLAWVRAANVTMVFVIAVGVGWLVTLVAVIPREASRRLVEDRSSGALELVLCTPLDAAGIVRGQWLALAQRYLFPVLFVILLSLGLMAGGYITFGFGGMLDPEDRGRWLFFWSAGIGILPIWLTALCWVAMRRALFAPSAGEASGIAFLQVIGIPGFALWAIYWVTIWAKWDLSGLWLVAFVLAGFGLAPIGWAWYARRILLTSMRISAAKRYDSETSSG
jgi:hypothetical protein